jgi:hemerythrin-like metal-binding protein
MGMPPPKSLEWRDSFSVGIPAIDDDHRRMIANLNAIGVALSQGDFGTCETLFSQFIDVAADHFNREEKYLFASGYPGAADHADHHKSLLVIAGQVRDRCRRLIELSETTECFNGLLSFLVDDILRADIVFKSYLDEKGLDGMKLKIKD